MNMKMDKTILVEKRGIRVLKVFVPVSHTGSVEKVLSCDVAMGSLRVTLLYCDGWQCSPRPWPVSLLLLAVVVPSLFCPFPFAVCD